MLSLQGTLVVPEGGIRIEPQLSQEAAVGLSANHSSTFWASTSGNGDGNTRLHAAERVM